MNTTSPIEWSSRRTVCPQCGARRGFASLQDRPEQGLCFACGYKNVERKKGIPAIHCKKAEQSRKHIYIPLGSVFDSLNYLAVKGCPPDISPQFYEEVERAAIQEYEGGMERRKSTAVSGLYEAMTSGLDQGNLVYNLKEIYAVHPFASWLIRCTSPTVLDDWSISLLDGNGVRYWYQNYDMQFVNAKLVYYDEHGHRRKDRAPRFEYTRKDGFTTCLFGEHQLSPSWYRFNPNAPVLLVESEKTAVMLSYRRTNDVCIATGGASSLTVEKAKLLKERKVVILYDADIAGRKNAEEARRIFESLGITSYVVHQFKERNDGYDLADWLSGSVERGA